VILRKNPGLIIQTQQRVRNGCPQIVLLVFNAKMLISAIHGLTVINVRGVKTINVSHEILSGLVSMIQNALVHQVKIVVTIV